MMSVQRWGAPVDPRSMDGVRPVRDRFGRWLGCLFCVLTTLATSAAQAQPPESTDARAELQRAAALAQVRLWTDAGELGKADALSRVGVKQHREDAEWHRVRLAVLDAASMGAWVQGEYARRRALDEGAERVFTARRLQRGEIEAWPDHLRQPPDRVERARVAVGAGEPEAALALVDGIDDAAAAEVRIRAHAALGDVDAVIALAQDWPATASWTPLAALFALPPSGAVRRAQKHVLKRVDAAVRSADDPRDLVPIQPLLLGIADNRRAQANAQKVASLVGSMRAQRQMDGFSAGPDAFETWELPQRRRWTPDEIAAIAKKLARKEQVDLPWARQDERVALARALAEALEARYREDLAHVVRERHLGPCDQVGRALGQVRAGQLREARRTAEDALFACLGLREPFPGVDPAGLRIDEAFDNAARAWSNFGRVAIAAEWWADAALATAIAAHLSPAPERVKLAARAAREAGVSVSSATGLPEVNAIARRLRDVPWLMPAQAVRFTRGTLTRANTLALLEPTAEHLTERATPASACLPTTRTRCQVEWAVARAQWTRQGGQHPDDLGRPTDPGALIVAEAWLDDIATLWFARRAALKRLVGGEAKGLEDILDADTGVSVGSPAPRWEAGTLSSASLRGKVVVLNFWASWCAPCYAELPLLDVLARRWQRGGEGVVVVAVNVDDEVSGFRRGSTRLELAGAEVVHAPELRARFRVDSIPATFVIDDRGVLRAARFGYDGGGLGWVEEAVNALVR